MMVQGWGLQVAAADAAGTAGRSGPPIIALGLVAVVQTMLAEVFLHRSVVAAKCTAVLV
jgi:hypothetical protein